jgi:hypothetical protein
MFGPSHLRTHPPLEASGTLRAASSAGGRPQNDYSLIEMTPLTFKSKKTAQREALTLDPVEVVHQESKKLLEAYGNFPFFLDLRHVAVDIARSRGLGCTGEHVGAHLKRLPGYRLGKYWRFRESEVIAWLRSRRFAGRADDACTMCFIEL